MARRPPTQVGDYLFRQSDETYDFSAVLSGAVEMSFIQMAPTTSSFVTLKAPSSVNRIWSAACAPYLRAHSRGRRGRRGPPLGHYSSCAHGTPIGEFASTSHAGRVPHEWHDHYQAIEAQLKASGVGPNELPVVLTGDMVLPYLISELWTPASR